MWKCELQHIQHGCQPSFMPYLRLETVLFTNNARAEWRMIFAYYSKINFSPKKPDNELL